MSTESKPREYYLNPKGTWIKVPSWPLDRLQTDVHVIEISAYEAVTKERDELKEKIETSSLINKNLANRNYSLREALETIKCRDEASNGDHGLLGIIAKQALEGESDEPTK